jgi:hypothetical protein
MTMLVKGGWEMLSNATKAHWFGPDGRSLCGKWLNLGSATDDTMHDSPDNCRACRKKRLAMENKS